MSKYMQFQCPIGVSENPSSNPNGPKAMDVHEEKKPGLTIVPPGMLLGKPPADQAVELSTDSETEEEAHRRRSGGRGSAGGDPKVDKKITEIVKQMEAKGQSGSIYVSDEGQHLKSQNSKAIISFVFNAS